MFLLKKTHFILSFKLNKGGLFIVKIQNSYFENLMKVDFTLKEN